jgi:hypothetical protein
MADGSTKAVADVEPGDMVASTDPAVGDVSGKEVQAHLVHLDTELTDITVKDNTGHASVIHTTPNHLFYDKTTKAWVPAGTLGNGDHLDSLNPSVTVTVLGVATYAASRPMYNLTVTDNHTYYVVAGTTPVLVHNCGGETLYRSDTRPPSEIFDTGFDPRGSNMDVLEHASGWSKDSGYVATTRSESVAIRRGGYVYEVRADGVDVNKAFPGNPFSHEQEVAVPGRIGPECIVACRLPDGTRVPNPNYGGR